MAFSMIIEMMTETYIYCQFLNAKLYILSSVKVVYKVKFMINTIETIKAKEPQTLRSFLLECQRDGGSFKRQTVCGTDTLTGKEVQFERYTKVRP